MTKRTRTTGALTLLAVAASLGAARAQQDESLDKPAREGAAALARALFFLAATKGAAAPADAAGAALSPDLKRAVEAVAASKRAEDLRANADDPSLARSFLRKLVDETPEAVEAQKHLVEGAAAKLANELDDLGRRTASAQADGQTLLAQASEGKIHSPSAVAAGKAGPTLGPLLLRLAKGEPFLRSELEKAAEPAALYRALARVFERPVDAPVERLLALASAVESRAGEALKATGSGELERLVLAVRARLAKAREATFSAMAQGRKAATALRQHELKLVVSGVRGADLEEAVRLLGAYKRAFNDNPALEATEVAGVYADRSDRIYFYLEGEDRWVRGPEHAANPKAVAKFLFLAKDPALARKATDARALASLYTAFGDALDFEKGIEGLRRSAGAACARVRQLETVATAGGATREAVDAFLAEHVGYDRELAGPHPGLDDAACADLAVERVARAFVEGGPRAGQSLLHALEDSLARLGEVHLLAFTGIRVSAADLAPGATVRLRLAGARLGAAPLVAPPATLAPGGSARCVVAELPGEEASGLVLEADAATVKGEPLSGRLALDAAAARKAGGVLEGGSLALSKGHALTLHEGPRGGARVRAGERLVLALRPERPARLVLQGPGDRSEAAAFTAEGGVVAPTALWPAGKWTAAAQDPATGAALARFDFEVEAAPGLVCEDAAGIPALSVKKGEPLALHFLVAGADAPAGEATVVLEHETGGVAHVEKTTSPRGTLAPPASLAPGRYRVRAELGKAVLAPWALALVEQAPRVALVRDPFALEAASLVAAGERLYARVEPGFALDPAEVADALLQLRGPSGGAPISVRATPVAGFPAGALLFPVAFKDSAPPGAWELEATITTSRGRARALGSFQLAPGAALPFALHPVDENGSVGEARSFFAPGERLLVRGEGEAPVASATFFAVGPDGLAAPLSGSEAGVALVVSSEAALGAWEVRGVAAEGSPVLRGVAPFTVYAPARFSVTVRGRAGEQASVDVPVPEGYAEPVRVRVGARGAWAEGAKGVSVPIGADGKPVALTLVDSNGRRALGEARVEVVAEAKPDAPAVAPTAAGPRFAVVANAKERTFFFPDYESVSRMLRSSRVPADWVVVDSGPLSAAQARDYAFAKVPYDGPREPTSSPLAVYRCLRFWKALTPPVLARFAAAGVEVDTIFDVTNSPSPGGEETLESLVRRAVDERGGWTFVLDRVSVRASGVLVDPAPPARGNAVRLNAVTWSPPDAANAGRILCPGVLGDLELRPLLPASLELGQPFAVGASVAAIGSALVPGLSYPGELEKLAPRALLAAWLEGSLDVEGKALALDAHPSIDHGQAGREALFSAVPLRTERLEEAAGKPRTAEVHVVRALPSLKPRELELRFEPVPPGALANKPRVLKVKLKARLGIAVAPADWPAERQRPDPETVGGAPFFVNPVDLPPVEVELEAIYVRAAADGAPPPTKVAPAHGDVRIGGEEPEALPPADGSAALARAAAAFGEGKLEAAEAGARAALIADPSVPGPWELLGETVLQRGRPDEALALLGRAAELDPTRGKPLVLLAEAQMQMGLAKDARAAAKKASGRKLDDDLRERIKRVLGE